MPKRDKTTITDWLIVLLALLDDVAVLGLILLALWFFKVEVPLPVIIAVSLLLGTFVFIIHKAIIPSLHKKKVTGAEGMIGLVGEVVEPLQPVGVVMVNGEYWKAKSDSEDIAIGEDVEILGQNGLTLKVRRKG